MINSFLGLLQMNENRFQNALKIPKYLTIPKTHNPVTIPINDRCPKLIVRRLFPVLPTV